MAGGGQAWARVGSAYRTLLRRDQSPTATGAPMPEPEPLDPAGLPADVAMLTAQSSAETEQLVATIGNDPLDEPEVIVPGPAVNQRSPIYLGFMAVLGGLIAYGLVNVILDLAGLLIAIVVSMILALGLDPLVVRLTNRGLSRGWAVALVFLGLLIVFAALGWLVVPTVASQTSAVINEAPGYLHQLQQSSLARHLNARWGITDKITKDLKQHVFTQSTVTSVFGGLLGATKAVLQGIVSVLSVLVLTLYFLAALPSVKTTIYQTVPRSRRPRVVFLGEEIASRVGGYVLGQVCIATLNGVLTYVILRVLGLPFPALLGIVVGLLALVPVIGTPVGGVIVTLVALTSSWTDAIIILGYYVLYHVIEAYVVGPRIMRRTVEIPPVLSILAILAGETLLGVIGALIAIPVAAALLLVYQQVLIPRQQAH
jgi:predicted PurR-regulated permease PerM